MCQYCHKVYSNFKNRRRHEKTAHTPKELLPHGCPECDARFYLVMDLKKHRVKHITTRNVACSICDKTFRCESDKEVHHRMLHEPKPFSCNRCKARFVSDTNLTKHKCREDKGLTPVPCPRCDKTLRNTTEQKMHLKRVHGEGDCPIVICQECGKEFVRKGELSRHMVMHNNNGKKNFQCQDCNKAFARTESLKKHVQHVHSGIKLPYGCKKCEKRFPYPNQLKYHEESHSDYVNTCQNCGKAFKTVRTLKKHVATVHSKSDRSRARQFHICNSCGQGFISKNILLKHEADKMCSKSSNEKKFPCLLCPMVFWSSYRLFKHCQWHEKGTLIGRPLRCSVCGKSFGRQDSKEACEKSHSKEEENQTTHSETNPIKNEQAA